MRIVVAGGGASGFMAAIVAAETFPNARVTILEKHLTVLNKVRISGGGRCNVTHRPHTHVAFSRNYPRGEKFMRDSLAVFDADATVRWFGERGVDLKTEGDGRIFPVSDSSETVISCLTRAARAAGVEIRTGTGVRSFLYSDTGTDRFTVVTGDNDHVLADRLLVAAGGFSKEGSFDWIAVHGHTIVPPVPSLFTFNIPGNHVVSLAGVSVQDVLVKIIGTGLEWRGPLLITHWGFSGPVILKLSAWGARTLSEMGYRFKIKVNWLPEQNPEQLREQLMALKEQHPRQQLASHPQTGIPARLWKLLAENAGIAADQWRGETTNKALNRFTDLLTGSQFEVSGKTTFKEEFVTCGGVSLQDINPRTMESRHIKGLFFSGEVMDVDGITGGFNFQHAWTSGYIAGKHIGME